MASPSLPFPGQPITSLMHLTGNGDGNGPPSHMASRAASSFFSPSPKQIHRQQLLSLSAAVDSRHHGHSAVEELWREFFSDPSQWWDHRMDKGTPNYPDFKHKKTRIGLWLDRKANPSWVQTELASMVPGSVSRSLFSWNAMLSRCVKSCREKDAMKLYSQMEALAVKPDKFIFATVLKACASLGTLGEGKRVHAQIIESDCESDVCVGNSLVNMYAKCGSIADAESVFQRMPARNVVSWGAMLAGYVNCELGQKALELFRQMQAEEVKPDSVTFVIVLKACASMLALEEGRRVHTQVIESGCESDVFVASALVDMYAKCGSIADAESIFQRMPTRNVVSWSAMLGGYVNCELGQKALELFQQMQAEQVKPDSVSFVLVLKACASMMALEEGRCVHRQVIESGCESDVLVGNSLVNMYAKCGSIADAESIFQKMPARNVSSWNAMLGGYAMHGLGKQALQLFQRYESDGVKMNEVTFTCLLSACSHAGFIEEGIRFFESMGSVYGVMPTVEHYVCMVDLLGRAGRLDDAENFLRSEPKISQDITALMALLGACRNHGKLEMGQRVAQQILELNPDNPAGYVLLSNISATDG